MSTPDVPGHNPANNDVLAMGCWAEHQDESLILVENTEGGRVIYSVFDMSKTPPMEYRDSMAEGAFKKTYSWDPKKSKDRWTWHDKTQFPWDKLIGTGLRDGVKHVHADDQISAAERIIRNREIHRGSPVDRETARTRVDSLGKKAKHILRRLEDAIRRLPPGEE